MKTIYYQVIKIDGDYALLKRIDIQTDDTLLIARALLPFDIDEGSKLLYENLSYVMLD